MTAPRSAWHTFRGPLAMALVSFAGLIVGLVAQGFADVIGFVGVTVPVAMLGWFLWRPRTAASAVRNPARYERVSRPTGDAISH